MSDIVKIKAAAAITMRVLISLDEDRTLEMVCIARAFTEFYNDTRFVFSAGKLLSVNF